MKRLGTRLAALITSAALIAGCAAADKNQAPAPSASSSSGNVAGSSGSASSSSGMAGMAGMDNGATTATAGMTVNGIKAVPSQVLSTAHWQGMTITARTMTAAPFIIYNGTTEQEVKPTAKTSFHLMVMLNDAHTGVPIPYAGVWATITKNGKVVYDERQWPMLSAFMGPHYGNNVSLPGAGTYKLTLLISPPISARHMEYAHVWLQPHRVTTTFHWKPVS